MLQQQISNTISCTFYKISVLCLTRDLGKQWNVLNSQLVLVFPNFLLWQNENGRLKLFQSSFVFSESKEQ